MKAGYKTSARALVALSGLLLASAPVQAADNLECLLSLRSDAVDTFVFTRFRAGENIGEALMSQRSDGVKACREKNGWSDSATETAARVILGEILAAGAVKDMARLKVQVPRLIAAMDGFLAAQPSEKLKRFADGEIDEPSVQPLLTMLDSTGVVPEAQMNEDVGGRIGEYISAKANAIYYRAHFKTQ